MEAAKKQISDIIDVIKGKFTDEQIQAYLDDKASGGNPYSKYADDPVGFCEEELGCTLTDDIITMMEAVRDYRVVIAISGNAPGKTFAAAHMAHWFYKCLPNSQVILTAPHPGEDNLKRKLWGEIEKVFGHNPMVFKDDRIVTLEISPKADNRDRQYRHFIQGITLPQSGSEEEKISKLSGSHADNIMYILDEGDAVPEWAFKAIDSSMSGGNARLLIMYNPKRKAGAAYKKIRSGQAHVVRLDVLKHPNVLTGKIIVPGGAVTREQTVKRINEWTEPLPKEYKPDATCWEIPDFLVGATAISDSGKEFPPLEKEWRKIKDAEFYYMVLGEYPAEGSDQLIAQADIDKAVSRWKIFVAEHGKEHDIRPVMGCDVADKGPDENVAFLRYGEFIDEARSFNGVDPDKGADLFADICIEENVLFANVESDGLGMGVAPHMSRIGYFRCEFCEKNFRDDQVSSCPDCEKPMKWHWIDARRVIMSSGPTEEGPEIGRFKNMRDQLWWQLREWLRTDPGAMLPPDDKLLEELAIPTYEVKLGYIRISSREDIVGLLGRSPDRASALIQCLCEERRDLRVRMLEHG